MNKEQIKEAIESCQKRANEISPKWTPHYDLHVQEFLADWIEQTFCQEPSKVLTIKSEECICINEFGTNDECPSCYPKYRL